MVVLAGPVQLLEVACSGKAPLNRDQGNSTSQDQPDDDQRDNDRDNAFNEKWHRNVVGYFESAGAVVAAAFKPPWVLGG